MSESNGLATEEQMSRLEPLGLLETVRPRDARRVMALVMGGYAALMAGVFSRMYMNYGHDLNPREFGIMGIFGLLFMWFVLRAATGYFHFITDGEGITLRGALTRRHVPWSEVTGAVVRKTPYGRPYVMLNTMGGKVRVDASNAGGRYSGDTIIASIWCNLKKIGRADGMMLPVSALRHWEPLPDDTPQKMEWQGSNGKFALFIVTIVSSIILARYANLWLEQVNPVLSRSVPLLVVIVAQYCAFRQLRRAAWSVKVRKDHIEADLYREKVSIPWSEISYAQWSNRYLKLFADKPFREIQVPYKAGNAESEYLMLSIIMHLREAGVAVAMPPVAVSTKPENIKKRSNDKGVESMTSRSYLDSLDKPVRERLEPLYYLQAFLVVVSAIVMVVVAIFDIPAQKSFAYHMAHDPSVVYFFPASTLWLFIPFFFGSVICMTFFTGWLGGVLAGPFKEKWKELQNAGHNRTFVNVIVGLGITIAIAGLLFIPLYFDCYAKVTDKGISTSGLYTMHKEEQHVWSDISSITCEEPNSRSNGRNRSKYRTYYVDFTDGTSLELGAQDYYIRNQSVRECIRYIAEKAGKEVQHVY